MGTHSWLYNNKVIVLYCCIILKIILVKSFIMDVFSPPHWVFYVEQEGVDFIIN